MNDQPILDREAQSDPVGSTIMCLSWQLTAGLPQQHAYDLVFRHGMDISADGESLIMGSTMGGLWISEDGGDFWGTVSEHLPPIYCVRFV